MGWTCCALTYKEGKEEKRGAVKGKGGKGGEAGKEKENIRESSKYWGCR